LLFASALVGLSLGTLSAGDVDRAAALCEEGLAVNRLAGDRRGMYFALYGLMEVARAQGDVARAVALMEEAHALTRQQGDPWSIAFALSILGSLVLLQGDPVRAEALQRESLGLRRAIDDAVGIGRSLDGLGWAASAQRQFGRAARLFGAAEALREQIGAAPHLPWRAEHERWVAAAWVELGEETFAAAWAEGRALSLDDVVAYQPPEQAMAGRSRPSPGAGPGGLSPRELEVALLIAQGLTNRRIAETLVIAEWTVDTHVRHILNKLGFRSRAQVAAWASERGLVSTDR
jgi:non-specific serine/threonine protein kinase